MPQNSAPETDDFDLNDWLLDANLPEDSVDVFKGANLISEISVLQRRITEQHQANEKATERTSADKSEVRSLEAQYNKLVDRFGHSRLTIYVKALTPAELKALREKFKDATGTPAEVQEQFNYALLAESIFEVSTPGQPERRPVSWTANQIRILSEKIGEAQTLQVLNIRNKVQLDVPTVDADFLLKFSGKNKDDTQD